MSQPTIELAPLRPLAILSSRDRERLQRRARSLAWTGNAWHLIEFAIAVSAGLSAGSIALIGFGVDSLIEGLAGFVIIWLFTGARLRSATAEQRAQRLIAFSYFLLGAYVTVESIRDLGSGHHPDASWVGIGLAAFTAATMPLLARAKKQVGRELNSSATVSEAGQNMICAYLSVALLVGLSLNAVAGLWWADPAAALVIAAIALREGREGWRGEACDCC
jgi:divalent metal cation (Fe/Co/Zn/Cd) transporter